MDFIYTLLGLLGGIVGTRLVANYLSLRRGNYDIDKDKRKDIIAECYELINRLQKEREDDNKESKAKIKEIEKRLDQSAKAHAECEKNYAKAEERIGALEEALTQAGVKHRPWKPEPKSGVYTKDQLKDDTKDS